MSGQAEEEKPNQTSIQVANVIKAVLGHSHYILLYRDTNGDPMLISSEPKALVLHILEGTAIGYRKALENANIKGQQSFGE